MNKYKLRKNFTSIVADQNKIIRGKLAFKTKETHWLETEKPVIILTSIHSAFHDGVAGNLKMDALTSVIRSHVKGKVTVLLSDRAHLRTLSLSQQNNLDKTLEECLMSAYALSKRYLAYFKDCQLAYWHSYVCEDPNFLNYSSFIREAYHKDLNFRELLHKDAETTYVPSQQFPDKKLYLENSIEDILEQCTCLLVLANKGYRFQFYPGSPYSATEYVNRSFISEENQIHWIDVFLTIEKKTITPCF